MDIYNLWHTDIDPINVGKPTEAVTQNIMKPIQVYMNNKHNANDDDSSEDPFSFDLPEIPAQLKGDAKKDDNDMKMDSNSDDEIKHETANFMNPFLSDLESSSDDDMSTLKSFKTIPKRNKNQTDIWDSVDASTNFMKDTNDKPTPMPTITETTLNTTKKQIEGESNLVNQFKTNWNTIKKKWEHVFKNNSNNNENKKYGFVADTNMDNNINMFNMELLSSSFYNDSLLLNDPHMNIMDDYTRKYFLDKKQGYKNKNTIFKNKLPVYVSKKEVIWSILHGLLGIPSKLIFYHFNKNILYSYKCFCKGISSEVLSKILQSICETGTHFLKIKKIVNDLDKLGGVIPQTFSKSIEEYVNYYSKKILELPGLICWEYGNSIDIMEVLNHVHVYQHDLSFIYNMLNNYKSNVWYHDSCQIIEVLYNIINQSVSNHQTITVYLFQSCIEPCLNVLYSWIFKGELMDLHHEFTSIQLMEENKDLLLSPKQIKQRNKKFVFDNDELKNDSFMDLDSLLITKNILFDKLPVFLKCLQNDIQRCGWSLNVLKNCNSDLYHCCCIMDYTLNVKIIGLTYDELQHIITKQKEITQLQQQFFDDIKQEDKQKLDAEHQKKIEKKYDIIYFV